MLRALISLPILWVASEYAYAGESQSHILVGGCAPFARVVSETLALQAEANNDGSPIPESSIPTLEEWVTFSRPSSIASRTPGTAVVLRWNGDNDTDRVELEITWDLPADSHPTLESASGGRRHLHLPIGKSLRDFDGRYDFIYHAALVGSRHHPFSSGYLADFAHPEHAPFANNVWQSVRRIDDIQLLRQLTREIGGRFRSYQGQLETVVLDRANMDFVAVTALLDRLVERGALSTMAEIFLLDLMGRQVDARHNLTNIFWRRIAIAHWDLAVWHSIVEIGGDLKFAPEIFDGLVRSTMLIEAANRPRQPWENMPGGRVLAAIPLADEESRLALYSPRIQAWARDTNNWFRRNPTGFPVWRGDSIRPGSPQEILKYLNFFLRTSLQLRVMHPLQDELVWTPRMTNLFQERMAAYFLGLLTPEARARIVDREFLPEATMRRLIDRFLVTDPDLTHEDVPLLRREILPAPRVRAPRPVVAPPQREAPVQNEAVLANRESAPPAPIPVAATVEAAAPLDSFVFPTLFDVPLPVPLEMSVTSAVESGALPVLQWIAFAKHRLRHTAPMRSWEQRFFSMLITTVMRSVWIRHDRNAEILRPLASWIGSSFTNAELQRLGLVRFARTSDAIHEFRWPRIDFGGNVVIESARRFYYQQRIRLSVQRIERLLAALDRGQSDAHLELDETITNWLSGIVIPLDERPSEYSWVIQAWLAAIPETLRQRLFRPERPLAAGIAAVGIPVVSTTPIPPVAVTAIDPAEAAGLISAGLQDLFFGSHEQQARLVVLPEYPRDERYFRRGPRGEPGPIRDPLRALRTAVEFEEEITFDNAYPRRFSVHVDDYRYVFETLGSLAAYEALLAEDRVAIRLVEVRYQIQEGEEPTAISTSVQGSRISTILEEPPLVREIAGAPYFVTYRSFIERAYARRGTRGLPREVRAALRLLGADLAQQGVLLPQWGHFGSLAAREPLYHAHLNRNGVGYYAWVAIWRWGREVRVNGIVRRTIEIVNVGRRNAHGDQYERR